MYPLVDLTDKRIVVAGASSGIGQGTVITLSRLGARCILIARREEKLKESLALLEGDGHRYYCADLSKLDEIEALVKLIVEDNGPIDGLVYSAGVGSARPLAQFKPDMLQNLFNINYFGFIETVRQLTKKGRFGTEMRIVGVSSSAALIGTAGHVGYSSSKAAMNGAVRCMAIELSSKGIQINTVAPSWTKTILFEKYLNNVGENEGYQHILRRQYLGPIEVQSVANLIAFLLSPAAQFITGTCVPIDGGFTSC